MTCLSDLIEETDLVLKVCSRSSVISLFLLVSGPVHGQPAQGEFIMLIFVRSAAEAWTMNAGATGDVAVCRQTAGPQGEKHNECRHGTQPQTAYAELQSLGTDLRSVPGTKVASAANSSELQVIVSQYGGMRYDRSQVTTNPTLRHLLDLMVQTNLRVGGDDFVPHF
jgi:hypothetical protein